MTILKRFIGQRFVGIIIENVKGQILLETCSLEIAEAWLKNKNLLPIQAELLPEMCSQTFEPTGEMEIAIIVS